MAIESDYIPSIVTADETSLTKSSNQFSIKSLGVSTAKIAANAVTLAKMNVITGTATMSGGTSSKVVTATGMTASSLVFIQMRSNHATTHSHNITMSGAPGSAQVYTNGSTLTRSDSGSATVPVSSTQEVNIWVSTKTTDSFTVSASATITGGMDFDYIVFIS